MLRTPLIICTKNHQESAAFSTLFPNSNACEKWGTVGLEFGMLRFGENDVYSTEWSGFDWRSGDWSSLKYPHQETWTPCDRRRCDNEAIFVRDAENGGNGVRRTDTGFPTEGNRRDGGFIERGGGKDQCCAFFR
ncbi:hypothetical protein Zmor_004771 [Zophobas morio]|uniref:Uncharacterized protein n=1 Tax=Zophobas morio TaxID=2755281 RepID=A0AA38ISP2_9CUCU|nr:hypothetical protein Zmor_004771 [Zophobas morio]